MSSLVPVEEIRFARAAHPATAWGLEPELKWLALNMLLVDKSYQRDILDNGRTTIRRIVEQFRWSRFGQLVVSARPSGVYAIVDGQHRATACRMLGIVKVPCIVLKCSIEEEAEAFAAINGNVTRPSTLQIFHAKLVAGDRNARVLDKLLAGAGVSVPRYAVICDKPGMCTAISTLEGLFKSYGAETLERALGMIVELGDRGTGMLKPAIIGALCQCIADPGRPRLADIKAALADGGLAKIYAKAQRVQSLDGGAVRAHFVDALLRTIDSEARKAA